MRNALASSSLRPSSPLLTETKRCNQKTQRRNSYPSRSRGLLSNEQKAKLCILSRQAFAAVHFREPNGEAELSQFRHEQVQSAVGKSGLRVCVQDDFLPLKAWFLDLMGESGQAMDAHIEHAGEARRLALYHLEQVCAMSGHDVSYAGVVCRSMFKCALDEASAVQLWKLVFRLKSRLPKRGVVENGEHQAPAKTAMRAEPNEERSGS